jgi:hypothetical protein
MLDVLNAVCGYGPETFSAAIGSAAAFKTCRFPFRIARASQKLPLAEAHADTTDSWDAIEADA